MIFKVSFQKFKLNSKGQKTCISCGIKTVQSPSGMLAAQMVVSMFPGYYVSITKVV